MSRVIVLFPYFVLVALGVFAFWQVHGFDFLVLEDRLYTIGHPVLAADISPWKKIAFALKSVEFRQWIPVAIGSHLVDLKLFRGDPSGHHMVSVAIHLLTVLVVFRVLIRLGVSQWVAFFSTALLLVHPQRAQVVAWVAERKDMLSYLFAAVSLLLYVEFRQGGGKQRWFWRGAIVAFGLGLASRYIIAGLPIGLLLVDRYLGVRSVQAERDRRPFWIMGLLFFGLTAFLYKSSNGNFGGDDLALWERTLVQWPSLTWRYLEASFGGLQSPFFSGFDESYPMWVHLTGGTLLVGLSLLAWFGQKACPLFTLSWGWFLASLLPVAGILVLGPNLFCDHYAYFPHFFLFVGAVAGVSYLIRGVTKPWVGNVGCLIGLVLVGMMTVRGKTAVARYANTEVLMSYEVKVQPENPFGHFWRLYGAFKNGRGLRAFSEETRVALGDEDESLKVIQMLYHHVGKHDGATGVEQLREALGR